MCIEFHPTRISKYNDFKSDDSLVEATVRDVVVM